jgi:DUF1009 family protein
MFVRSREIWTIGRVIGERTIKHMIRAKAACLAIEAGKTLVIDREACVKLANRHNICLVGV